MSKVEKERVLLLVVVEEGKRTENLLYGSYFSAINNSH